MSHRRDRILLPWWILGHLALGLLFLFAVGSIFLPVFRNYVVYDSTDDLTDGSPRRVVSGLAWRFLEPPPPRYIIENDDILFLRQVAYRSWIIQWVPSEIAAPSEADIAAWRREDPALDAAMKRASDRD